MASDAAVFSEAMWVGRCWRVPVLRVRAPRKRKGREVFGSLSAAELRAMEPVGESFGSPAIKVMAGVRHTAQAAGGRCKFLRRLWGFSRRRW